LFVTIFHLTADAEFLFRESKGRNAQEVEAVPAKCQSFSTNMIYQMHILKNKL